ncbi:MAG: ATP-dependent Clp protease adaptor ClpS [Chitinophagaceae bacterium]|nr:ATP-dependent Clp protease adaptor ClpS [Chitinophagaceae bacterium]
METEVLAIEKTAGPDTTGGAHVILFNDDYHTFDDVIFQLILAINCSYKAGEKMAQTVHTEGKCKVYEGAMEECLSVSAILEEINLKTEIGFE